MPLSVRMESDPVEDVFLQEDLGPTIAQHALQCRNLFQKYMAMSGMVLDPTLMDDQLARFTLWTSTMDVFGPLNVSLDYRLRYSPTVVDIIHQLLDLICDALSALKPIDEPPQTPSRKKRRISEGGTAEATAEFSDDASDTDSGDEDQEQRNVSLITYTIGGTVTRLFRLSNAIRKSAKSSRMCKMGEYIYDEEANNAISELRLYTEYYIRFRFPQAPETLRSALVEANAARLRRLYYQRSHRRRVALSIQDPQAELSRSVQIPKLRDSAPTVRFAPNVPSKPTIIEEKTKATGNPPAPVTYATTARQSAVRALYADSAVEVPRAKSVLVNNKLSFPPVPKTSECPYCGVIVEFKDMKRSILWNDHIIRDLEPFICTFTNCEESSQAESGPLTFETSKSWLNHMQNAHRYAWECRAPSHDPMIFEQEVKFQEHSCREHDVPEAHVGTLSGAARRPIFDKILECPFGDDFQASQKVQSNNVFSTEALHLHVAAHMKEIALLALQKLPSDEGDDFEYVDSDAPLEDDDDGFAKLRGSMYSVLGDEELDFLDESKEGISKIVEGGISSSVEKLDLDDKDGGVTMLHRAVRNGDFLLVQALIDKGVSLRSRANYGKTALHNACLSQDDGVAMMQLLLDSGARETVNLKDDNGQTPLHYAAKSGFTDGIQLLVNNHAIIDIVDNYGVSPYLWAVITGQNGATKQLLSFGVNANSTSANGKSALGWAANLGWLSIIESLVKLGVDVMLRTPNTLWAPLEEAATSGNRITTSMLLDLGVDPNFRDREGWSAIHWAAEEGHFDIVRLLLDRGADANAVSSYGTSALHCAANGGHVGIVLLLIQSGADLFKSTCHGWTPLHHAAFMGHADVVQSLLNDPRMVSCPSQDNHNWSILHLAVHGRHLDTARLLLNHPMTSESRLQCDERGLTAEEWLDLEFDSHFYKVISKLAFGKSRCCRAITSLRLAAHDGNIPLMEFLLEEGCDINGTDSGRRTALYYAAKKAITPMINLLLRAGADPNILPAGYTRWEEFILNDVILQRLRQAGYTKPNANLEMDQQIKLVFKEQGRISTVDRAATQRSLIGFKESEAIGKAEEQPSRVSKLWKRLRGE